MPSKEETLRILIAKKETLFRRVQRLYDCSRDFQNKAAVKEFRVRFETLQESKTEFYSIIDRINAISIEIDDKFEPDFKVLDSFDELYGYCTLASKQLSQEKQTTSVTERVKSIGVRLPKLELPSFGGQIAEWPIFYQTFQSLIHENVDLDPINKLHYLLGRLSGKALTICSAVPPIAENYELIWQTLIEKYDDKRLIANHYMQTMLEFKQARSESGDHLNAFLEKFDTAVSALKGLKLQDLADFILSYLALSKLDNETIKSFEIARRDLKAPTYNEVLAFVKQQSKILGRSDSRANQNKNKQPDTQFKKVTQSFVANSTVVTCIVCQKNSHPIYKCDNFLEMSPNDRYKFAKEKRLCINCLSSIHRIHSCNSQNFCGVCHKRHNTLLHWPKLTPTNNKNFETNTSNQSPTVISVPEPNNTFCSISQLEQPSKSVTNTLAVLPTALIKVETPRGDVEARVLVDSASTSNFITTKCCKKLGLPMYKVSASVAGIGAGVYPIKTQLKLTIRSKINANFILTFNAYVIDKITDQLPATLLDANSLNYLYQLPLADPAFGTPSEIEGILGAEIFAMIIGTARIVNSENNLTAMQSSLGYLVVGGAAVAAPSTSSQTFCAFASESIDNTVKSFFELEEVPHANVISSEDAECEKHFVSTVQRDGSGRYTVSLPFKQDSILLGRSYETAFNRFLALERKFDMLPEFKNAYAQVMQEHIKNDYMTLIVNPHIPHPCYFIPHQGVLKPQSKSTPLRVVWDCSSKTTSGKSLNDLLHAGPKLQTDLLLLLLNFRIFEIAMTADLKKMFLQILVKPEHRKYQLLLWRSAPKEPISIYQFNRLIFGSTSSPYLALRTVQQLALDERDSYPLASNAILKYIYMDDFVHSVASLSEGKQLYSELLQLFRAGGFQMAKWCTNAPELMQEIPESFRLEKSITFDDSVPKVLGLQWHPHIDCFYFTVSVENVTCSKRNILSTVARIFDPLGFLAPVILYAKILIKELWAVHVGWDDKPPQKIVDLWNRFYSELHLLRNIKVTRHVSVFRNSKVELIGFSDASEKGYGGVVYLRSTSPKEKIKICLLCAKSKVSPLKIASIPRLELCAALLLSKLLKYVIEVYSSRIEINEIYAFTDSMVVLSWIHASPHRWSTFVANRVSQIQDFLPSRVWYHVEGRENPADCLSRGLVPSQFLNTTQWLTGPKWLSISTANWPIKSYQANNAIFLEEKSASLHVSVPSGNHMENPIYKLILKCSSWTKLLNTTVYVLRFIKLLPKRLNIEVSDLIKAEHTLIRIVQEMWFKDEIMLLEKGKSTLQLKKLRPFLMDGLIRVGGRLTNADVAYDQRHPILLPKHEHLTNLIIGHIHKSHLHTGPHLVLCISRQKYWILSARGLIRKIIKNCNFCFKRRPLPTYPIMGDLPACRVASVKPFMNTGVDYSGPFYITLTRKRGVKSQKAYVCLFVCMATRAVHLELVSDLSTDLFLAAFKRFLSRRGPCSTMFSDCGTNFLGASTLLAEVYSFVKSESYNTKISTHLTQNQIEWKFLPPRAPHMGGIWEAQNKSIKSHLHKTMGNQILSYEEFSTILIQIEAILNSRPLTWLSSDPSDPQPLTPAHFLTLTPLNSLPAINELEKPLNRLNRKQLLDHMVQHFWKRWHVEYLHTLQSREKWNTPSNPVKVGTLVLIHQDNTPPLRWPLGVVEQIFPGQDGVVRVATVRTNNSILKRPVVKLCPLPAQ